MRAMPLVSATTSVPQIGVQLCVEYMRGIAIFSCVADAYSMCTLPYIIAQALHTNNLRQAEALAQIMRAASVLGDVRWRAVSMPLPRRRSF